MINSKDTIVARATPLGTAGVGIVRLSGPGACSIADRIFRPAGSRSFLDLPPRYLAGGTIMMEDRILDQCLAVRFQNPHSFTGDDVVEFHLHGNLLIAEHVINLCIGQGARLATAGEFTKRAFLNGKIDLTQVEALADVLASESEQALFIAQRQLHGELRDRLQAFRDRLLKILALLELELDFVQEGYHFASIEQVEGLLEGLRSFVGSLLSTYQTGARLRRGPRVLLLGRPNAGKSSLFNALVGHTRALVSPVAGTTRDYLEEPVAYGGVQFRFVDTAGLRSTEDLLEAEGVARAIDLVSTADHLLYLIDGVDQEHINAEIGEIARLQQQFPSTVCTPVFTKSDLRSTGNKGALACSVGDRDSLRAILDHLLQGYTSALSESIALLNHRQFLLLDSMRQNLAGISYTSLSDTELLSDDLRALLRPLSELTGDVVNDDVLNTLFSSFCIGK